jgi:hypothetical protein
MVTLQRKPVPGLIRPQAIEASSPPPYVRPWLVHDSSTCPWNKSYFLWAMPIPRRWADNLGAQEAAQTAQCMLVVVASPGSRF